METSNNRFEHVTDVYFFGTCVLDIFMPEAGVDAMTLLEQQGIRLDEQVHALLCQYQHQEAREPQDAG